MSVSIPFQRDFDPVYGEADQVSPLIQRLVAKNPGAFTFTGTGTYIVGHQNVAVIDPGPDMESHISALLSALKGRRVTHILVTHTHMDHSPASRALKAATGAPVYAFGPHGTRRADPGEEVEEGADHEFRPDHQLKDGETVTGEDWTITAVHTPGHTSNHLCFALKEEKALFTGDHVMGWSTTVVSPPDGDMAAYMRSLEKLTLRDDQIYWPTHGLSINQPIPFVQALLEHRRDRESQILECVTGGLKTVPDMVASMYRDVPEYLHPAAARSVLAHIIHMVETRRLHCEGAPTLHNQYELPQS